MVPQYGPGRHLDRPRPFPRRLSARQVRPLRSGVAGRSDRQVGARYRLQRGFLFDSDERYLAQARLASEALGEDGIEFRNLSIYDVGALGERFDLVIFMGVFYHLRHPLLALDLIREHVADDLMLFQTMQQGSAEIAEVPEDHPFFIPGTCDQPAYFGDPGYPKMHFIERRFADDWTNWWAPNAACSQALLRAAGFTIEANPESDVYLCRVAPVPFAEYGPAAVHAAKGAVR
jgi:tRNA (mo5U34)-methyltransferase